VGHREGISNEMNHWFRCCFKSGCNLFGDFSIGYGCRVIWLGVFFKFKLVNYIWQRLICKQILGASRLLCPLDLNPTVDIIVVC
jgi:hypothetical protein